MADTALAPKPSTVSRMTSAVAGHPRASLAIIVALTVLVVALYVYYHGLLSFGPYNRKKAAEPEEKKDADPEIDRLVDSINSR